MTAGGWGKRTCTTAAPSTLFGGGGKRTITRSVTSTLSRERNKKSIHMGGLVQGHRNLVGGHYVRGELDRPKDFADLYAALNSDSFSSDTYDDGALKLTAHSNKKITKRKLKLLIHN